MEFNYLAERTRMLDSIGREQGRCTGVYCEQCPIFHVAKTYNSDCANFEGDHPFKATEVVRKWTEENPRKL